MMKKGAAAAAKSLAVLLAVGVSVSAVLYAAVRLCRLVIHG